VNCGFDGICHKELLVCKKLRKAIDKRGKVEYTINVGATSDGCFLKTQLRDNRSFAGQSVIFFCYKNKIQWQIQEARSAKDPTM